MKYDGKFGLHLECKTTVAFTYVLFAGIDEMISVNNLNSEFETLVKLLPNLEFSRNFAVLTKN